ncbi:MAG TPA: SRPBCC family protein [Beijerinckiaceae bacterium]|nr:SRPBCC family protein [Beijerinckiaceae bacterium]
MAIDVEKTVLIRRGRADVAAYMFDPANDAAWTSGVVASRPLTGGLLQAGSRVERTTRFLGREFGYVYYVVDADKDRFVEIRVDKPFPMQARYQLDDATGGTRVRIRARGEAGGFFRLAGPLLALMVGRSIAADLDNLRRELERDAARARP